MSTRTGRRRFLKTTAGASALLGLGDLGFLSRLRPVSADEARLDPGVVRLRPEIEPLVALLEETPRDRLLEEVAARIRRGTSYQEVLAALLLAGVRNVQPRPNVGFKFHAVLVVNSAHLASLASPDADRWLPIFWALDYFKDSQARDEREGNWTMGPVDESAVPPARHARQAFIKAMDNWDEGAADAAVVALARTAGATEVFGLFQGYGARDFRSIGHKAIYVANAWRTLQCIGWQHAEPVLRSLAYALLNTEKDGNPSRNDYAADRPWRANQERADRIREGWQGGDLEPSATTDLLDALRTADAAGACDKAVELLNRGVAPQSLWDAMLDGSGELVMKKPGIVALHAATTTNALRYAFEASADDRMRRLLLLQNAAFVTLFRDALGDRDKLPDRRIDDFDPAEPAEAGPGAIEDIFAQVGRDRSDAARKALAYLQNGGDPVALIDAARRLVFLKGNDAHDYKYSSAVLEDYFHASPAWRDRYLASSLFLLPGSSDPDNTLIERTRAAFA